MGIKIKRTRELTEVPLPVKMWVAESESKPGIKHITMKLADDNYICTCDGFQIGTGCWHTRKSRELDAC